MGKYKIIPISKQSAYQKVIYIELDSQKSFRCLCFGGSWPFDDEDIWRWNIRVFFYNANQKPSEVERELKDNLLKLARSSLVSPFYCENKSYCKSENVRVYV